LIPTGERSGLQTRLKSCTARIVPNHSTIAVETRQ
jgi:hypothetical protein